MGMKPILSAMALLGGRGYHPRLDRSRARRYRRPRFDRSARSLTGFASKGEGAMKRLGLVALLGITILLPSPALAQVKQVYWATSGFFGPFPITDLIPSVPKEKAREVTIPVSMWVIDHPKGLVVFDTGNNAAISDGGCKQHWAPANCDGLKPSQKRDDVIDRQLQKIGLSADKVKVVITSHAHLDHIGNIKLFPKAIHAIQKKELYQAWWPEKFQRAGGVFLMGQDAIWMQENLDGYPAGLNYSVKDYTNSVNRLKMMRDLENADLFFAHDQDQYKAKGGRWYK